MGPLELSLDLVSDQRRTVDSISVSLSDRYGTKLVNADTLSLRRPVLLHAGHNLVQFRIDALHLNPGTYSLGVWVANPPHEVYCMTGSATLLQVVEIESERIRVQDDGLVATRFSLVGASSWAGTPAFSEARPVALQSQQS